MLTSEGTSFKKKSVPDRTQIDPGVFLGTLSRPERRLNKTERNTRANPDRENDPRQRQAKQRGEERTLKSHRSEALLGADLGVPVL